MIFKTVTDFMHMVTTFAISPDQLKPTVVECSKEDNDLYQITINYNNWSIELIVNDFVPFLRLDVDPASFKKVTNLIVDFINSDNIGFATTLSIKDQQIVQMYCDMFIVKFG